MMISTLIKRIYKKTVPLLLGYHSLCLVLRSYRAKNWEWVDRIPVKPGLIVLVNSIVGDFYMSRPERCSIAKKYFWTKGVREPVEDRIALNLFSILSRDSDVVLDIGANSGLFSLVAAKSNPDAKIIAFDILLEAYHILIDNLALNDLLKRVEIQLSGVGEEGGSFTSPFNTISSEMPSSLSLDSKPIKDDQIQVPIKSLDEICFPRFKEKKICIKIDVEGTEIDIFENGRKTLRKLKPDIICEVLLDARQFELYDKILDEYSYKKYLITDVGLKRFDIIKPDKVFKDWFFTTKNSFDVDMNELLK